LGLLHTPFRETGLEVARPHPSGGLFASKILKNKPIIMKNQILIYLLALVVLIPGTVSADSLLDRFAPGTSYNPIEMQIVQDPYETKRQENLLLESQLKARYGYSLYNSCTPSSCTTADSIRDPYARSSCLRAIESCAQSYQTRNSYATNWDNDCKSKYGAYAKLDSVNEQSSTYSCGCISGFEFNSSGTACVPVKTQDQLCSESYPNSRLIGGYCDCPSGYQFNAARTRCDVIPAKTNEQVCQDDFGVNSSWDGTKTTDGRLNCACKIGYSLNDQRTSCVFVPAPSPSSGGSGGGSGYTPPELTCAKGYTASNGQCITNKQNCINELGPNATWDPASKFAYYTDGKPQCDCATGYYFSGIGGKFQCRAKVEPVISTFTYQENLSKAAEKEMTTNSSATLRSCPARTCDQKGVYPAGIIFTVRQQYEDSDLWYRGTTPDGNDGWIYSGLLTDRAPNREHEILGATATNTPPSQETVETPASTQELVVIKKSGWKKIISWFTFWK
jgi:hypothetical protein